MNIHWKDWCWSWNSNTWCKELTYLKRPWCWERLKVEGEGDHRGWDSWMASPTQWTWVWVNCGSWWWTGRPGVLQSVGSQRVRRDWVTKLTYWSGWPTFFFFERQIKPIGKCLTKGFHLRTPPKKLWKWWFLMFGFLETNLLGACAHGQLCQTLLPSHEL